MNELAVRPVSLFPSPAEWSMLKEQATMAVKSGLLPRAVDTPEKAIVIALKGRELGIPPMQAFSHIHIVDGKPTISAELMLSLIYKNANGAVINYPHSDEKRCEIEAKRAGHKVVRFSFSIEEAQKAGLLAKNNWKSYPAAMLRARAVAIVARAVFPDAIQGCSHTPEELGAEVDEDGQVVAMPEGNEGKSVSQSVAPVAEVKSKPAPKRGRKEIGAEIMAAANELSLSKQEVEKWTFDEFGKGGKDLTIEEMETFLGMLSKEVASRGEAS